MQAFRKELKFYCTEADFLDIENRIKGFMKLDSHQNGDYYNIRSIYFDSPTDICFYENSAGVGIRNKYRIRIYNKSNQFIRAEIKSKYRETITKASKELSLQQFDDIMGRKELCMLSGKGEVLERYLEVLEGEAYHPVSIVEYERKAYIYQPCNVRITFDRNIAASAKYENFFEPYLFSVPVLEKGLHVLEIKFDEFLPDLIQELLYGRELKRISCSKYYLSRLTLGRMYL